MNKILFKFPVWVEQASDIILQYRIRLSRNLENVPFVHKTEMIDLYNVNLEVKNALAKIEYGQDFHNIEFSQQSFWETECIKEKLYLNDIHVKDQNKILFINDDMDSFIVTNSKDHIRLYQYFVSDEINTFYQKIDELDNQLCKRLNYAYHRTFGYLSPQIINTGTGLKISALLHLPGTNFLSRLKDLISMASKYNFILRSMLSFDKEKIGNLFILENEFSYGFNEETIISNFAKVIDYVYEFEKNNRLELFDLHQDQIKDKIFRAWGILNNSYMLNVNETYNLFSAIRLGIFFRLINQNILKIIKRLSIMVLPGHLRLHYGITNSTTEFVDKYRAEYIKQELKKAG